ncbi:MAG: glycoside hydrolase family 57 protein [archaeon]|nr:glycoside hydrolase family 57 protein [archaeon]
MSSVCFYFEVHQPRRVFPGHVMNVGGARSPSQLESAIFDDTKNRQIMNKVAGKCYYPANQLLLEKIDELKNQKRKFKISYSLSGVFIDMMERCLPDLLESFRQLAETGCVEFLSETYYHSLSSFWGKGTERPEFIEQVNMHRDAVKELIGYKPVFFRNTELLINNSIAKTAESMGFKGMLAEGIEWILDGWKSPEHIYRIKGSKIPILLRNYKLSDDMSYRFSARWFSEWPITADKYSSWLSSCQGESLNLFMDYETFGEHQWEETGIFYFMKALPNHILDRDHMDFATPSEIVRRYPIRGNIDISDLNTLSWADMERDTSAWLGNNMQRLIFTELERIGRLVKEAGDPKLISIWRFLQTSDHLYYMCTKNWNDGDVHKYFSPYGTPHEAFEGMIKALSQLEYLAKRKF